MGESFDPTQLTDLDHELAEAWRTATAALGISVIAPFELPVGETVFRYGALVVGFGTERGVLLRAMPDQFHADQCGAIWREAREAGYLAANLSPLLCRYDRDEFILCLKFWPWCGPASERPDWHTGCPDEET